MKAENSDFSVLVRDLLWDLCVLHVLVYFEWRFNLAFGLAAPAARIPSWPCVACLLAMQTLQAESSSDLREPTGRISLDFAEFNCHLALR